MASHIADVIRFNRPAFGELVLNGEVEGFGIRGLQLAVQAPGDREPSGRRRIGEGGGLGCGTSHERKRSAVDEARRVLRVGLSGRIANRATDAVRAVLVESIHQRFAVMVVVNARAETDGGLIIHGVSKSQAGCKVVLRLRPESWFAVERTGRRKVEVGLVDLPG